MNQVKWQGGRTKRECIKPASYYWHIQPNREIEKQADQHIRALVKALSLIISSNANGGG
jgi:hypothetical protein